MVQASWVEKAEESVENSLLTCKWYAGLSDGPLVKKWLFWFDRFGEAITFCLLVSVYMKMNTLPLEQTHETIQTCQKRTKVWLN